jgi:hypothetical protein
MKKEELRPISYISRGELCNGFFHNWIISKYSDNGEEYAMALIEESNGDIVQIEAAHSSIRFLDRE